MAHTTEVDIQLPASHTGSPHYRPIERPQRYPLELSESLEIYLWSEDGKFRWVVARVAISKDAVNLRICGDRALDRRVNWQHFRELYEQAIRIGERTRRDQLAEAR